MIQICEDILLKLHLLLLLTSVCETSEILTFTAHERGTAEIRCPYESGHEELQKYLCRGECLRVNKDKAVKSESEAKDKRFSLTDNKTDRIFTVTITDLRTEDQGKYWCGVTTGFGKSDYYREIHLEIKLGKMSGVFGVIGGRLSITCRYEGELKNDVKFICKESNPSLCEESAIKVSSETNSSKRFSLSDDESAVFTVTITGLREEDSGIYWCGAVRRGQERKSKWISVINLRVSAATTDRPSSKPTTASFRTSKPVTADTAWNRTVTPSPSSTSSPSSSSSLSPSPSSALFFSANTDTQPGFTAISMVVVIVILTGLGSSLFLYLRRRQKKEGTRPKDVVHSPAKNLPDGETREVTHTDCDYEDISSTLDHPDYSTVLLAFTEHDAPVYALAQLPSSPSDDLNYSSIRFPASRLSDRTSDEQETCHYSTVRP
ncbi:CMRF35-like molecule 8 isoform X4 [Puntigrus tetrazona]|uniref:CMRF35-like molecule 8 isoform X3 n=1 Tax=Puntigrus tetrazona TaxID=1606681 RepID=UPI001C8AC39E|nr:CMRF35-like molecule 8 isoform X3 [Puntigrus tetrazona]XP_043116946.1 CMRF35-like molecule 8 isoform X4 [Puntigrus tetrazona]